MKHTDPTARISQVSEANSQIFQQMTVKQEDEIETAKGFQSNKEYYEEYCKLYVANSILLEKLKDIVDQKEEQVSKLKKLQVRVD